MNGPIVKQVAKESIYSIAHDIYMDANRQEGLEILWEYLQGVTNITHTVRSIRSSTLRFDLFVHTI